MVVSLPTSLDVYNTPKNGRRVLHWTAVIIAILAYMLMIFGLAFGNFLQNTVDYVTSWEPGSHFGGSRACRPEALKPAGGAGVWCRRFVSSVTRTTDSEKEDAVAGFGREGEFKRGYVGTDSVVNAHIPFNLSSSSGH